MSVGLQLPSCVKTQEEFIFRRSNLVHWIGERILWNYKKISSFGSDYVFFQFCKIFSLIQWIIIYEIVGGESAQSHPTRDVSYTHLNAMNSQRWGNVHRECLSKIVIDWVFSLYSFMYIGSHDIHSTVRPFFLNVCMTITLRNADYGCRRRWKYQKGRPQPYINLYGNI